MQNNRRFTVRALIFLSVSVIMLICYMIAWNLFTGKIEKREERRLDRSLGRLSESITSLRESLEELTSPLDSASVKLSASKAICAVGLIEHSILDFEEERDLLIDLFDVVSCSAAFAEYCAEQTTEFGTLSTSDRETLMLLIEYIAEAERIILRMESEYLTRKLSIVALKELSDADQLQELFDDFPIFTFDHVASLKKQTGDGSFIKNALPVTKREAEKKVQTLLESEISLNYCDHKHTSLEVYSFWCDNTYVEISKNGGYPIRILRDIDSNGNALEQSVLLARMSEYLLDFGYPGLTPLSYDLADGIFTAEFIYREERLIDHTCRVKIACLADSARITLLDAASYAINRGAFSPPKLSTEAENHLLFDGGGNPHYCILIGENYVDVETGARIYAPMIR